MLCNVMSMQLHIIDLQVSVTTNRVGCPGNGNSVSHESKTRNQTDQSNCVVYRNITYKVEVSFCLQYTSHFTMVTLAT